MLLAIDTATHLAGLALYDQEAGWILGEEMWQSVNNHTVELMPRLVRLMEQQRIALETREIYAPLAHRLGMAKLRWELEDLAFKYLEPQAYRQLAKKIR